MKYENKSFSVSVGENQSYRDGWDRIFGKDKKNDNVEKKQPSTEMTKKEKRKSKKGVKPKKKVKNK